MQRSFGICTVTEVVAPGVRRTHNEADSVCRCRRDAESVESMCTLAGLYSICVEDELDRRSPGA